MFTCYINNMVYRNFINVEQFKIEKNKIIFYKKYITKKKALRFAAPSF